MLAIDSSKFFHVDSTQISASKLSSIMRVGFQMSIKKKKKKAHGNQWQMENINKDNWFYSC